MCLLLPFFVVVKLTAETEMNWVKKKLRPQTQSLPYVSNMVVNSDGVTNLDKWSQILIMHIVVYSFPVYSKWVKRFEKGVKSNIIDMFCYFLEHKD